MNIYSGLLFMQGHITNVELARQLAGVDAAPTAPPSPGKRETACGAPATGEDTGPGTPWQPDPCATA